MNTPSPQTQPTPATTNKGIIYAGRVIEVGPPTSSFAGTKISYLRLQQKDGNEISLPGMVVLSAIAPYVRLGADVTVYVERCCFQDIMFGVKTPSQEAVSDDLGPVKAVQYWSYIPIGLGIITLCIGVGLIFLAIGIFVYVNTRPPKPEQVLAALREAVSHQSFGTPTAMAIPPIRPQN